MGSRYYIVKFTDKSTANIFAESEEAAKIKASNLTSKDISSVELLHNIGKKKGDKRDGF